MSKQKVPGKFEPSLRLKEVRISKGLTIADFACKIGITEGGMRHVEAGRSISTKLLVEACATFDINPEWLMTGEGEPGLSKIQLSSTSTRLQRIVLMRRQALAEQAPKDAITKHDGHVREPPSPKYGSPPGQITMAQAMEAIATQLALPVEKVREAVTGLLKSENDPPKKKG